MELTNKIQGKGVLLTDAGQEIFECTAVSIDGIPGREWILCGQ